MFWDSPWQKMGGGTAKHQELPPLAICVAGVVSCAGKFARQRPRLSSPGEAGLGVQGCLGEARRRTSGMAFDILTATVSFETG